MKRQWLFAVSLALMLTACDLSSTPTLLETQAGWQRLGSAVILGDTVPKLALDSNATPYVAWYEVATPSRAFVKVWNGSTWQRLGGKLNVNPNSNINDLAIAVDSLNRPVVAWSEFNRTTGQNYVYVKRWNGTTWTRIGTDLTTNYTFYLELVLTSNLPLIAFDDGVSSNTSNRSIYVKRWNGTVWESYGTPETNSVTFSLARDYLNRPVLAYEKYSNGLTSVLVKRWQNNIWATLGKGVLNVKKDGSSKPPVIAVDSQNRPVVVWSEYTDFSSNNVTLYAKRYSEVSTPQWFSLGTITTTADGYSADLTIDGADTPIVAWTQDYDITPTSYIDKALYVSRWDSNSTTWQVVGNNPISTLGGYAGSSYTPTMAWSNNTLVTAWRRLSAVYNGALYNGGIFVKRFTP
jgi:voltage-gated potassium channel Kch